MTLMSKIWRNIRIPLLVLGLVILTICLSVWTISVIQWPQWSGINGKTAWDLADLLIVPLALAIIAFMFNRVQRKSDREIAKAEQDVERKIGEDRVQETALQIYFDRMTELLLKDKLKELGENSEIRSIARTRTLIVLRSVNGFRKGSVIRFLYESNLIQSDKPTIDLTGADLTRALLAGAKLHEVNFSKVDLTEADLRGSDLYRADLRTANLEGANLYGAYVTYANLSQAGLVGANLERADLRKSDLTRADPINANLHKADLEQTTLADVNLTGADLTNANLKGANLEDANLTGAVLFGTNFRNANLTRVDLENALWRDMAVYWPENFTPPPESTKMVWWHIFTSKHWWTWFRWWRQKRSLEKQLHTLASESLARHERVSRVGVPKNLEDELARTENIGRE